MKLIYMPALGMSSPSSYLLQNNWASSPMTCLDTRLRGTAAFHPYALCAFPYWRGQRFVWEPEHFIFGDSGGYSVHTLGAGFDPREVLLWQLRSCSVGALLDSPPVGRWSEFRECLEATVTATKVALPLYLAARERGTPFRWWGVVHGRTAGELEEWWTALSRIYPFSDEGEGWAFKPMTDAGQPNDPEAMRRVLAFIEKHVIRRGHFFATTGRNAVETLAVYGPRAGLVWASADSTSPIKTGAMRTLRLATPEGSASVRDKVHIRRYMLEQCACTSCDLLREDVRENPDLIENSTYLRDRMMFHNTLQMVNEFGALAASPERSEPLLIESSRRSLHLTAPEGGHERTAPATPKAPTPSRTSLRVLSCVPQQRYSFEDKLAWVADQAKKHEPDVIVLPQEYHGGIQHFLFQDRGTTEKVAYHPDEIIAPYTALAKKHEVGILVGAVVDDPGLRERRERIYVMDPKDGVTGYVDKMFLPAYDHHDAKQGETDVYPETNFENRARAFDICGARVGVLFCWEVHSDLLWRYIARSQPDFVVSMIKFGVNGWPRKPKKDSLSTVPGFGVGKDGSLFGFGKDGDWVKRLRIAANWFLAAPIICSTNSWNQPKKAGALAGQILPWEEKEAREDVKLHPPGKLRPARRDSLWMSEGKGTLDTDHVQVDQVDYLYWRHIRDDRHKLRKIVGQWPSNEARALTMNWKIRRMERKFAAPRDH